MRASRLTLFAAISLALALVTTCQKGGDAGKGLAKVGSRVISRDDFAAFSVVLRTYPHALPTVYPAGRKNITFMVETVLMFPKIPSSFVNGIKQTDDWTWKMRYFPGQAYALDILRDNMGAMESDIETYYKEHKLSFVDTIKINDTARTADSTAGPAQVTTRDSIRVKELAEVRAKIIKSLFLKNFPPESIFVAQAFGDSLPDSSVIRNRWFYFMQRKLRTRSQDFFLTKIIKELYGETPPDSIEQWARDKGLITDADIAVITSWLPQERRAMYATPERQNELVRWLLRWKVYSEKSMKVGYTTLPKSKAILDWALKVEAVTKYIATKIEPQIRTRTTIDTSLCTYSYWDNRSAVQIPPDSTGRAKTVNDALTVEVIAKIDSMMHRIRAAKKVKFLQADYRDDRDLDPQVLAFQADSCRDSGSADDAEKKYRILTKDFAYTPQGHRAFAELAKLQTEKQRYSDAIKNYRRYLICAGDSANRCNTFFMIGFIYDEYLSKPELAEVNYKWVLKNAPDCELNDDAEFMMTHLDEPMVRIEDLRSEALRQGRKIDYSDDPLDAEQAATAKNK